METNKKIAILMSTYNGERFLNDQIKSIINQTYSNWELYIRDDGSTDTTQQIIKNYAANFPSIHFLNEGKVKNVGVSNSFMSLLRETDADFYMFADQDDFWKPRKIEKTLRAMISVQNQDQPICVHTDLQIVDSSLQGNELMNNNDIWHQFTQLMFGNCVTGCTVMLNQALKKKINFKKVSLDQIYMHDWWIALIAAYFGEIVYVNEPTILYRQHGDNVVGSMEKNTIFHLIHRIFNQKVDRENLLNVFRNANLFEKMYGKEMTGKDKLYVEAYGSLIYRSSFWNNLATLIKFPPLRNHLKGKLFFSYLMLQDNKEIRKLAKL